MSTPNVEIVAYDARWPAAFAVERDRLSALADHPFVDIEHFGSTAVRGLSAKPVVDIMASVARLEVGLAFAPHLTSIGYALTDVGFTKRLFFSKAAVDGVGFHLHLVAAEAWADKNERLFRDWLVAHPEVAAAYARLKTDLAQRFSDDPRGYTRAKTSFIEDAVNDARRARVLPPQTVWEE